MEQKTIYTVYEINQYLKYVVENDTLLKNVFSVEGELSNFKPSSTGSYFFTLKDRDSKISCAIFSVHILNGIHLKDGDKVRVSGSISVWDKAGTYNIIVKAISLAGLGELYEKYEALKKEFLEKGYFEDKLKREIPLFPKKIGIVTAKTGAVIHDIETTINNRYRLVEIILFPCTVQGSTAASSIVSAISKAINYDSLDILIIGRGGGSFEDLFPFSEREVVEIIHYIMVNTPIVVITAIGHEVDTSISDLVSDKRAATPTAAAMLSVPNMKDIIANTKSKVAHLRTSVVSIIDKYRNSYLYLIDSLGKVSPSHRINNLTESLKNKKTLLNNNMSFRINKFKEHYSSIYMRLIEQKPKRIVLEAKSRLYKTNNSLKMGLVSVLGQKKGLIVNANANLRLLCPLNRIQKLHNKVDNDLTRLVLDYSLVLEQKRKLLSFLEMKLKKLNPLVDGPKLTYRKKPLMSSKDINVGDEIDILFDDGKVISRVIEKE